MTPAARLSAAIEVLDRVGQGQSAERELTNWARASRYAGSKDRAAVRDIVFDVLRMWRSCAAIGGGETGRARVIGYLRQTGQDIEQLFDGSRHGPSPLEDAERHAGRSLEGAEALDLPDWLAQRFEQGLGEQAQSAALAQRQRAPVFLRVNLAKATRQEATARLLQDGILAEPLEDVETALKVLEGARGIARSNAYLSGLVELQDASSQAVVQALPLKPRMRVLDFCAGGGGKTLAMAARVPDVVIDAHDADARRMKDLPERAKRAGANVRLLDRVSGQYDLVICDVPCSGSGAFRRAPEGKWRLTEQKLADLVAIQRQILQTCANHVGQDGVLVYVTCSVLFEENAGQMEWFQAASHGWRLMGEQQFLPGDAGDGFYVAIVTKGENAI